MYKDSDKISSLKTNYNSKDRPNISFSKKNQQNINKQKLSKALRENLSRRKLTENNSN